MSQLGSYGQGSHIVCYSGGKMIYDGTSTGRVTSPTESDGWRFKSEESGRLMEVSGDCILSVGK
jgi:hypothetical protein